MRNSPPGIATRSLGLIFEYRELQFPFVRIDAVEDDAHLVADGELAAGALADDLADVLLISVLVARQRVDRNEAFDEEVGQLDEDAVLGGADDEGVEILADPLGHELHLFPVDQ